MRKVYLITATSMLLIFGCKKNSLNEKNIVLSEEESLKKAVSQLGFNTNEMIVNGDTLIVDEDIILYKSQLLKNGVMETMPRQAKAHNATLDKTAINIFISNNFSATERNLIISSLNEFRTANLTSVGGAGFSEINYVTNQGSADASIQWGTMNSNVCGYAEFPITYRVGIINLMRLGRNMYLNQSLFRQFLTTDSQRKKLIAHEFGHMIGLRHTNWRTNEAEFDVASGQIVGAYLIPGTDNSSNNPDPLSVFNSANCGSNWNGFSSFDRIAIRHLTNNGTQM